MWKWQELNKQIVLKNNTICINPKKEKKIKIEINSSLAIGEKGWERVTSFSLTRLQSFYYADGHSDTQEESSDFPGTLSDRALQDH